MKCISCGCELGMFAIKVSSITFEHASPKIDLEIVKTFSEGGILFCFPREKNCTPDYIAMIAGCLDRHTAYSHSTIRPIELLYRFAGSHGFIVISEDERESASFLVSEGLAQWGDYELGSDSKSIYITNKGRLIVGMQ